jgi:hypothetical protein
VPEPDRRQHRERIVIAWLLPLLFLLPLTQFYERHAGLLIQALYPLALGSSIAAAGLLLAPSAAIARHQARPLHRVPLPDAGRTEHLSRSALRVALTSTAALLILLTAPEIAGGSVAA